MVSQISSRLLGGYASSGSGTSHASESSSNKGGAISSGGYSADKEGQQEASSKPPFNIDLRISHHHKPKRSCSEADESTKRRRMNEMQFAASTVREDLARGGLVYPEIRATRPRAIPLAKLDMTRVHLLSSKDVTSPFLNPVTVCRNPSLAHDLLTDFGSIYDYVLKSCAPAYFAPVITSRRGNSPFVAAEDSESTSSVSDTASDDSQGSAVLVIHSRLDDAIEMKDQDQAKKSDGTGSQIINFAPTMAMDDALGVCEFSRIITTAVAPYTVVHANAAYGHFSPDLISIQGKTFSSVVSSGTSRRLSLANCAASSREGRDVTAFAMSQQGDDGIKCQLKVTPIVASTAPQDKILGAVVVQGRDVLGHVREVSNVTHFCIDLRDVSSGIKTRLDNNNGREATNSGQTLVSVEQKNTPALSVVG